MSRLFLGALLLATGCGEGICHPRREGGSIVVAENYPSEGRFRALGWVEWPTAGMLQLFAVPCTPEALRQSARAEFGEEVDAIYGYVEWRQGSQLHCGGTAVSRFRRLF